jgi:hypothetical protein
MAFSKTTETNGAKSRKGKKDFLDPRRVEMEGLMRRKGRKETVGR